MFILSCSKQDDHCGEEVTSVFTIHNYSEFSKFRNKWIINGNDSFLTSYAENFPGEITWVLNIHLSNVCNSDVPKLDYSISVFNPYPNFFASAIAFFNEYNEYTQLQHFAFNMKFSHYHIDYKFKQSYAGPASIQAHMNLTLPKLENFSADSAFFFSNLDSMSIKITTHKPE